MSHAIRSGDGNLYEAKVDKDLKLYTHATTLSNEHDQCLKGESFFAHIATTADALTVTTTGGPMLYIENTATLKNLVIAKVMVGSDQVATILKIIKNPTLGTIGNENTFTPVNSNHGSFRPSESVIYSWDEVGDGMTGLSAGTKSETFLLGAGLTVVPADDAIILTPGTSIQFNLKATSSTAECTLVVRYHYEDIDN